MNITRKSLSMVRHTEHRPGHRSTARLHFVELLENATEIFVAGGSVEVGLSYQNDVFFVYLLVETQEAG